MNSFRNGYGGDNQVWQSFLLLLKLVYAIVILIAISAICALPVWLGLQSLPPDVGVFSGWGYQHVFGALVAMGVTLKSLKLAFAVSYDGTG